MWYVVEVDACDLAEHHPVGLAGQRDDLGQFAFQRGRGALRCGRMGWFRSPPVSGRRGRTRPPLSDRLAELAFIASRWAWATTLTQKTPRRLYIGDAVLSAFLVVFRAGGGKHHLRRRIGDPVEERIGRQIVDPIGAAGSISTRSGAA